MVSGRVGAHRAAAVTQRVLPTSLHRATPAAGRTGIWAQQPLSPSDPLSGVSGDLPREEAFSPGLRAAGHPWRGPGAGLAQLLHHRPQPWGTSADQPCGRVLPSCIGEATGRKLKSKQRKIPLSSGYCLVLGEDL